MVGQALHLKICGLTDSTQACAKDFASNGGKPSDSATTYTDIFRKYKYQTISISISDSATTDTDILRKYQIVNLISSTDS
mgnify:CR=1 FL=1